MARYFKNIFQKFKKESGIQTDQENIEINQDLSTFIITTDSGITIPVIKHRHISDENFMKIEKCLKFEQFIANIDTSSIDVSHIEIRDIYMFGENVGFILANVIATRKDNGSKLSGVTFIRGKSVASFLLLRSRETKKLFVVLTDQIRIPIGKSCFETVAGMCDENSNSKRVTKTETGEEVGIIVDEENLHFLGDFYPSQGGCDESIDIYESIIDMDQEMIDKLNGSNNCFLLDDK